MKSIFKAALITSLLATSTIGFAAAGDIIPLDNLPMVTPGDKVNDHAASISLSKLSKDKFYTITGDIINTNMQDVDYKITTNYAMHKNGSIGDVLTNSGPLKKIDNGYVGHLSNSVQTDKMIIKNVKVANGLISKDHLRLENITPNQPGSGIEIRNLQAIEQADSGEAVDK